MEVREDGNTPVATYWSHVSDAASMEVYKRQGSEEPEDDVSLLSAETVLENASLLGIRSYVREFPEKIFPLIYKLREEFQELFIEYYVLGKGQVFLASVHGQIQTRIWQNLRIIEQAIGSLIILGAEPSANVLRPILTAAGLEETEFGSLTAMILLYAKSQSYALVAKAVNAPVPAIRKIFRPAIAQLLAAKDVKSAAVGSYLRSLTHQASLTGKGLSKKCIERTKRINKHFTAPPAQNSPLINFNNPALLKDTPWCMFEINSDHLMDHILPAFYTTGKRIFGKKPAQIFAPLTKSGDLQYGYIFARTNPPSGTKPITKIPGISEMAAIYDDEGLLKSVVTVPDADVQKLIAQQLIPAPDSVKVGDFVQIKTGPAARYCGEITSVHENGDWRIEVSFPTGRHFTVSADPTAIKLLKVPAERRKFWGEKL